MNSFIDKYKSKYTRRVISSRGYTNNRINCLNKDLLYWKSMRSTAKTAKAREFFDYMIDVCLKRYKYYISKSN